MELSQDWATMVTSQHYLHSWNRLKFPAVLTQGIIRELGTINQTRFYLQCPLFWY